VILDVVRLQAQRERDQGDRFGEREVGLDDRHHLVPQVREPGDDSSVAAGGPDTAQKLLLAAAPIEVDRILAAAGIPQGVLAVHVMHADPNHPLFPGFVIRDAILAVFHADVVQDRAVDRDRHAADRIDDFLESVEIDHGEIVRLDPEVVQDRLPHHAPAAVRPTDGFAVPVSLIQPLHAPVGNVHIQVARQRDHADRVRIAVDRHDDHGVGVEIGIVGHQRAVVAQQQDVQQLVGIAVLVRGAQPGHRCRDGSGLGLLGRIVRRIVQRRCRQVGRLGGRWRRRFSRGNRRARRPGGRWRRCVRRRGQDRRGRGARRVRRWDRHARRVRRRHGGL